MNNLIGKVTQGDCLTVMQGMPDKCVDLVLTDPPYGINLKPQRGITESIINDTQETAKPLLISCLKEWDRILKDNTQLLIFSRWSEYWFIEEIERMFKLKSCIVWVKNNFGIGYYTRPMHEFIYYCHKGKPPVLKEPISDVMLYNKVNKPTHSCEKPIKLINKLLLAFTKEDDLILDTFLGVGTTAVACERLGRRWIGIEQEEKYCTIARDRIAKEQNQLKLNLT